MTKDESDDLKALRDEDHYLRCALREKHLTLARRRQLTDELARVDAKIAAVRKKHPKKDGGGLSAVQDKSFLDTRASFFSEFAPNVFGGKPGALTPGSTTTSSRPEQHFHFNITQQEIPKNPHWLAQQARLAASAVMD